MAVVQCPYHRLEARCGVPLAEAGPALHEGVEELPSTTELGDVVGIVLVFGQVE